MAFTVRAAMTLGLWACAIPASPAQAQSAGERFKALYAREWTWREQQAPGGEDDDKLLARFPGVSSKAQAERLAYLNQVKAELKAIPVANLSPTEQVDYAVYAAQIDTLLARLKFREYEKPLNADSTFWTELNFTARRPFKGEEEYRRYISLLNDMPRYFDEQIVNMRAGLARGFTPPRITLAGRDAMLVTVAETKKAEDTVFYTPFTALPDAMPAETKAELRAAAVKAINEAVVPAHKTLLAFMRSDYMPMAREALAAETMPDGKAYYQSLIKEFTTTDLTADQIHALGLSEVASIRAQMLDVMREVNFSGDLPAFLAFLRTDPRFYAKTPDELLKEAAWITKQVDGKLGSYFGHLPRQRFTVIPVPDDMAPYYTSGRGGPGAYLVNTYNLTSRGLYSLRALTLHEGAPGHAFQMPLANESKDRPAFRRTYFMAYGEGWALYCEKLGLEMGLYPTPYDRFGMLSYQMWRAARLVVDTGVHAKGWTREQAQAFLRENTALSDHEIETEVDRYIAWPGQALAYYMGEMAIVKARAKAETALGGKFNIRAFHDTVLAMGPVPLPVMEAQIDRFIASGGVGPYPDEE